MRAAGMGPNLNMLTNSAKPVTTVCAVASGSGAPPTAQPSSVATQGKNQGRNVKNQDSWASSSGKTTWPKSPTASSKPQRLPFKPPVDTTLCDVCRRAGRPHMHDFRACDHFKNAIDEAVKGRPYVPDTPCKTCANQKRPCNHDYRTCRHVGTPVHRL